MSGGWLDAVREPLAGLVREFSASGGHAAIVVHDVRSGRREAFDGDRRFTAASLVKLPIMVAVLRLAENGDLPLDTRLPLTSTPRVGGSGVLAHLAHLDELSVHDLLTLMIGVSDNVATNVLVDVVGIDAVNACIEGIGLPGTAMRRRLMDLEARARGLDNHTTADDMTDLLARLAAGELLGAAYTATAEELLLAQQFNDRLPRDLPERTSVLHKTGELPGIRHDAGIVRPAGGAPFVIAVLTEGSTSPAGERAAADMTAEAALLVHTAAS